jgi:hypothetical protein
MKLPAVITKTPAVASKRTTDSMPRLPELQTAFTFYPVPIRATKHMVSATPLLTTEFRYLFFICGKGTEVCRLGKGKG